MALGGLEFAALGALAGSTIGQGVIAGTLIGGGLPALMGKNRHEIGRGALFGGLTGGAGAGIGGLAAGQNMAQLIGLGEGAAAGAGTVGTGIDTAASKLGAQIPMDYDVLNFMPDGMLDLDPLTSAEIINPMSKQQAVGLESSQEAMRELGSLPSRTALNTMSNLQPAYTPPPTSLYDDPLKYVMENPKSMMYAGLTGLSAAQTPEEPPKKKKYESPYVWQNPLDRYRFADGGIASLPGYDMVVGETPAYAQGGMSDLGSYSDGGRMLRGAGDGMSDSIPGVIAGKRPARLADGEFVVPADVVSHLGNGSTDAGAKQLYQMMDKVRAARTGTRKQGRQINPRRFMPA